MLISCLIHSEISPWYFYSMLYEVIFNCVLNLSSWIVFKKKYDPFKNEGFLDQRLNYTKVGENGSKEGLAIVHKEHVVKYCLRGKVFSWKLEINPFWVAKSYHRFREHIGKNIDSNSDNVHEVETWIKGESNRVNNEMGKLSFNAYC